MKTYYTFLIVFFFSLAIEAVFIIPLDSLEDEELFTEHDSPTTSSTTRHATSSVFELTIPSTTRSNVVTSTHTFTFNNKDLQMVYTTGTMTALIVVVVVIVISVVVVVVVVVLIRRRKIHVALPARETARVPLPNRVEVQGRSIQLPARTHHMVSSSYRLPAVQFQLREKASDDLISDDFDDCEPVPQCSYNVASLPTQHQCFSNIQLNDKAQSQLGGYNLRSPTFLGSYRV
jgi:hypothetical protein